MCDVALKLPRRVYGHHMPHLQNTPPCIHTHTHTQESTCSPSMHGTAASSFTYSPMHEPPSSPHSGAYSPRAPSHMAPHALATQGPHSPVAAGSPWLDNVWGGGSMGGGLGSGSLSPNARLSLDNNTNTNMAACNPQQAAWGNALGSGSMSNSNSNTLQMQPPQYTTSLFLGSQSTTPQHHTHHTHHQQQQQQKQQQTGDNTLWSTWEGTTPATMYSHSQFPYATEHTQQPPSSPPHAAYAAARGVGGVGMDGVPQAALMAAAQVGSEALDDLDVRGMMAALSCG